MIKGEWIVTCNEEPDPPHIRYMKLKADRDILGDEHWPERLKLEFELLREWWSKVNVA